MANISFPPPVKGLHEGGPVSVQPQYTSPDLQNVRVYDVTENRARVGQRPGLKKWADGDQVGGVANAIVSMTVVHLANPLPGVTPGSE